jgi:hypothetical protein
MQPQTVRTAKIIPIRQQHRMLHLQLDQLVGFEGVKILSGLIQEWHTTPEAKAAGEKRQIKQLAMKANLTPTTVSRIMNRETMSPRMLTCIMLFKALGFSAVRFE